MRLISWAGVSFNLLKRHALQYVGCGIVIAIASIISTAELVLFRAFMAGNGIDWSSYSNIEAIQIRRQLDGLQVILILMFLSAVVIALFLVFAGVRDVIMFRQRELALIRLIGARQAQVRKLVTFETIIFSFLIALPASILGHILAGPFYSLLQKIGVFGEQLHLIIEIYPAVVGGFALIISILSGVSAFMATRNIMSKPLLESVDAFGYSAAPKQWFALRMIALTVCLCLVFLLDPGRGGKAGQLALLVPLLIVIPLISLAPYIVSLVAAAVGKLLQFVFPGPMLLIAQRARRDADRFTSTIMPVILAVGLLSGFFLGNAPDEALRAREYNDFLKANFVVSADEVITVDAVTDACQHIETISARFGETRSVAEVKAGREIAMGTLYFTDFQNLTELFSLPVSAGEISAVHENSVASSRKGDQVGDSIKIAGPQGTMELRVAAVINTELYEGLFIPWEANVLLGVSPQHPRIFLKGAEDLSQALLSALPPHVSNRIQVSDRTTFIAQQIEARRANTNRSNVALFGTIYLMATVSLIQSAISSGASRRREYSLYRSLGLSNRNIITLVALESLVLAVVSAFLLGIAIVLMYWRFIGAFSLQIITTTIPWVTITNAFIAITTLMLLAAVGSTIYSLKLNRS